MQTCSIEDCEKLKRQRGYCSMHYRRVHLYGDPHFVKNISRSVSPVCAVENCERKTLARGWCSMHYNRWSATGDVRASQVHNWEIPEVGRFESFINRGGINGCWEWTGSLTGQSKRDPNSGGYGKFKTRDQRTVLSHRYSYELYVGLIGEGLTLDHLCRNRACCNPEHLEPVTQKVNSLRGESVGAINARKTHCIHGHEFTEENTRVYYHLGAAHRACKTCTKVRKRRAKLPQQEVLI
ncbi:HNH endonuclease [Rhodococcus fascians]|nr:HNH endonuclease [Rhodococcus fascians]MBY4237750.1 HNH endonuclease [Rhodococcus fascians]MBY4253953.1 HNH endonuclease [Rhodococcus fascians]MBY4269176.1 HNH endonuclease [Rhodococcus fascians]